MKFQTMKSFDIIEKELDLITAKITNCRKYGDGFRINGIPFFYIKELKRIISIRLKLNDLKRTLASYEEVLKDE